MLTPGLSRPPARMSTVARSSARRSGFSQPSGITAVPNSIVEVRWDAAASTAIGEEMPYWRWRWRTQALSKPRSSPSLMISSVDSWPGRGSAPSNRPMVRKPSLRRGRDMAGPSGDRGRGHPRPVGGQVALDEQAGVAQRGLELPDGQRAGAERLRPVGVREVVLDVHLAHAVADVVGRGDPAVAVGDRVLPGDLGVPAGALALDDHGAVVLDVPAAGLEHAPA